MDRSGRVPLHVQVAAELRDEIRDHRRPPGSPLDSEAALRDRFGVARSVVRQALGTLVAEGLVERGRGRGSVVAPAREHHRLVQRASGLYAQMSAGGLAVTTEVLALDDEPTPADAGWLGTTRCLRLERLRRVDGQPLARIRTYLPLPQCEDLDRAELTDASLHDVLTRRYALQPSGGRRQIRAVAADADLAAELATPAGSPLLLLEGQSTDQSGRPLEVFATWHRAADIAFDVEVEVGHLAAAPASTTPPSTTDDPAAGSLADAAEQAHRLAHLLDRLTH